MSAAGSQDLKFAASDGACPGGRQTDPWPKTCGSIASSLQTSVSSGMPSSSDSKSSSDARIRAICRDAAAAGFEDIFNVTKRKVVEGITTTEEAVRVLGRIRQD